MPKSGPLNLDDGMMMKVPGSISRCGVKLVASTTDVPRISETLSGDE